jgi:hypothetical protein
MNTRLGPVLSSLDLPLAELCGARLDGELFALDEFWCPIDEYDGPASRAVAAGFLVPARCIAERVSAAWIYGLVPEPLRHQFCVDAGARAHIPPSPRFQVREVRRATLETRVISGLRVTTQLRTAVDLARGVEDDQADPVPLLAALLRHGGFADTEPAARLCLRPGLPYKKRALRRLAEAQALLDLPRLTCSTSPAEIDRCGRG